MNDRGGPVRRRIDAARRGLRVVALVARDPRTPWTARAVAGLCLAYALSPIDLVPDVIPVLGLLDDALLVPLGVWLALRLTPRAVVDDARQRAATDHTPLGVRRAGIAVVLALWLVLVVAAWLLLDRLG